VVQLWRRGEGEVEVGRRLVDAAKSAAANQLPVGEPIVRRGEGSDKAISTGRATAASSAAAFSEATDSSASLSNQLLPKKIEARGGE